MEERTREQFDKLKSKHPDALLLFRCGDYYETYLDDAEDTANILGIVLHRQKDGTQSAGFPHFRLDEFLPRIIRAGKRVCICEQLPDYSKIKLAKRGSTEQQNLQLTLKFE